MCELPSRKKQIFTCSALLRVAPMRTPNVTDSMATDSVHSLLRKHPQYLAPGWYFYAGGK